MLCSEACRRFTSPLTAVQLRLRPALVSWNVKVTLTFPAVAAPHSDTSSIPTVCTPNCDDRQQTC